MSSENSVPEKSEEGFKPRAKMTLHDLQRRKIQKLMSDPNKPVFIPTKNSEKDPNKAPDFVYNVMGSSAGAGSGEFHVYRQIRRKEMARQKILEGRRRADVLNAEFVNKMEETKKAEENKTSKKRAKRQRRKEKMKAKKAKGLLKSKTQDGDSSSISSSEEEEEGETLHSSNEERLLSSEKDTKEPALESSDTQNCNASQKVSENRK
ncbi:unnamed protein product [Lepeophtheirus salmonis]|uniref:(salmon louse) hypothetical protein n=1 Tax=Lepeophtheirus salmonis TaxID=72036 RepID=A0A7R8HAU6_LEPSM|nr:unnamed protein product [Lepeophtheirus salmonis]CAF2971929.1 unnamed protein product [Lepeophtheirus salmonis]